jgi:hypothetical protein
LRPKALAYTLGLALARMVNVTCRRGMELVS